MKTTLFLSVILLLAAATFTQAQSKKDIENDFATCVAAKDSLQKALTGLTADHESMLKKHDSIVTVCIAYDTLYSAIRRKVIFYHFDPLRAEVLIDSLSTHRESAFSNASKTFNDSITSLNKENADLKAAIEALKAETADKTDIVTDLKQLKELLDTGIITQEEFDAKKAKLLEKL